MTSTILARGTQRKCTRWVVYDRPNGAVFVKVLSSFATQNPPSAARLLSGTWRGAFDPFTLPPEKIMF